MRLLLNSSYWVLLIVMLVAGAEAQVNPVYQEIQKNRKAITKGRREVKPGYTIVEPYVDLGYDDSTLARLKTVVGVDMEKLWEINPAVDWNAKLRAALADCIVIGTVSKKEYSSDTSRFLPPYLTIAHLNVDEFLRNDFDVPSTDLQVMINSGPVAGNRGYQTQMGEDTLIVGERYLLFLSAHGLMAEALSHKNIFYKRLIDDPTVKFKVIMSGDKEYRVRDGYLYNRPNDTAGIKLQTVKDDIKKVVDVISKRR